MVKDQIDQFLALADSVRAAKALDERRASLEQACAETQTRLADLRDQESKVGASVTQAYDEAKRVAAAARDAADKLKWAGEDERTKQRDECDRQCRDMLSASHTRCDELSDEANRRRAEVAQLEDEESRLAQSVTALKSELEQLRAKFA